MNITKQTRVDSSVPLLLRFQDKALLLRFIDSELSPEEYCSEKLLDLYASYKDFCEECGYSEPLKKRAFKKSLKILLKEQNVGVLEYSSSAGLVLGGIGLKNSILTLSEKEKEKQECVMA